MLATRFKPALVLIIILLAAGGSPKAYGQSIVDNNIGTQNIITDEDLTDNLQNLTGSNASRIISNGYLAKSAILESAADLAANVADDDYDGLTPFGSISGQSMRYPSHIDVKGFSGITGLAYGGPMTTATWTTTAAACGAALSWLMVFTATPGSGPAV